MKWTIAILLVSHQMMASAQSSAFVPLEYEYPAGILSTPKTYVYKNTITSDYRYKDISRTDKNGQVIITWKEYDSSPLVDSSIEINNKAVEHYLIINGQKVKEVITEDSIYRDGTKLEKRQAGSFTLNPAMVLSYSIRSHYLKDTVLQWKGKDVLCIVVESTAKQYAQNPLEPTQKKEMDRRTFYFFGKATGLIKYTSTGQFGLTDWELEEIKEK